MTTPAPEDIKKLVDRFLSWPLPASVRADDCASIQGYKYRSGTNLLSADEARQMFEYLFADAQAATIQKAYLANFPNNTSAEDKMKITREYVLANQSLPAEPTGGKDD